MKANRNVDSVPIHLAPGFTPTNQLQTARRIAYKEKGKVFVGIPGGKEARRLFSERNHRLNCPLAWSHDGRTVYQSHKQIYALDTDTGDSRAVTKFRGQDLFSANWLLQPTPDGSSLIFLHMPGSTTLPAAGRTKRDPHRLCAVSVEDGTRHVLFEADEGFFLWKADAQPACQRCAVVVNGNSKRQIWVVDMDGQNPRLAASLNTFVAAIALSPEGERIAYWGETGIFVLSVTNGTNNKVTDFGGNAVWSPDGSTLAFMEDDHALWNLDVQSGKQERLTWLEGPHPSREQRKGSYATTPVWSPDGNLLWFRLTRAQPATPDPAWIKKLQADFSEKPIPGVSEADREQMLQDSIEICSWQHDHYVGVVDFARREVWSLSSYWMNVAWSPTPE